MKIHLFDWEHSNKFPRGHEQKWNATKCGYVRDKVTKNKSEVTCKLCLKRCGNE